MIAFGLSCAFAGFMVARVWNWLKRAWLYRSVIDLRYKGTINDWLGLTFQWYNSYFGESRNHLLAMI